MSEYHFTAGTKAADFVTANNPVDMLFGPLGSGKTKGLCIRPMRHAQEQDKSPVDGFRYTRFAMVRNTMPDLKRSTVRTWLETFPEDVYGRFNYGAVMQHKIAFGDVRSEFDFISLDKSDDVKKLRSTEYTGICFNEIPFIEKPLFDEADSRLRYPPTEHCVPDAFGNRNPKWRGILADGNAPDEDHWTAAITGMVDMPLGLAQDERAAYEWPPEWGLHVQPPALLEKRDEHGLIIGYDVNPDAENLKNLPSDYYQRQLRGKSKAWIDSRLMVRVALVVDGQAVWPMFRREYHVAREPLRPVPGHDVLVGLDFGRVFPAAVFGQQINGRIYLQYEMLGFNEGPSIFAPKVKRFLEQHYPGFTFRCVGDPKGQDKHDEKSAYDIFKFNGMHVAPAPVKGNDIEKRLEAVAFPLNDNPSGINTMVFSPLCRTLIVGMAGRYHLTREETGELHPKKDKYSNLCDALQYFCLGLGEGRRMVGLTPVGLVVPVRMRPERRSMRRVMA